ncbi:piggyBac transposable element-derived protein 4-like [Acropora millepora]|uniref:piggyBac transposable element-derived protein 4-like n=1 Tax=Acropora millepora TaxID=45264 RepID=UPI001CF2B2B1|nr:piggyBac transposable element-derived protein 4-like [Acropora millepora]
MLAVRLNDKKEIYFLSTMHKANVVDTGKRDRCGNNVRKLQLVHDYNKYMGGVDRNDELLGTYCCVRNSMKWTKKVAFPFMEESLLNAHILYKKSGGREPLLKFKLDCISALLAASSTDPMAPDASDRFSGRHFPELIPPTAKKQTPQKKCEVCSKEGQRKESKYQCGQCNTHPGLCAAPCFKIYHTQ